MFNKRHDGSSQRKSAGSLGRRTSPSGSKTMIVVRNNNVDEGIITFGLWLNAEDKSEGVPFCNQCRSNDCAHVGFAICAEQIKQA